MFAAVVLAGGAGRRVGGAVKPALHVGGRAMLSRVLDGVAAANPKIVVGPPELTDLLPDDVTLTRESPPGGGPVAALAAGLALATSPATPVRRVVVVAADLPFLSAATIAALLRALDPTLGATPLPVATTAAGTVSVDSQEPLDGGAACDGAVLLDARGRPQWLAGVWRLDRLTDRLAALGDPAGRAMRDVIDGLRVAHVPVVQTLDPPPWFDCDTAEDIRQAEEWARVDIG